MFEPRSANAAFTVCARNYFAQAQLLAASFKRHHPETDFHVILVDRPDDAFAARFPDIHIVWAERLGLPNFAVHAMRFDVIELSTNIKPHCLSLLLDHYGKAVYLDPDTYLFDRLDVVFDALDEASVVVTPASMTPVLDGHRPDDIEFLRVGVFNLGFVGVSACAEGRTFTRWWNDRCLSDGFHETQSGVFVDQKWINLAPCYFERTRILRDPGLNMAPWNVHERRLSQIDDHYVVNGGGRLKFFHFSSFDPNAPQIIAKRQTRFKEGEREDLHTILADYGAQLLAAQYAELSRLPYSYDWTPQGDYVSPTLRRMYANPGYHFPEDEDPWQPDSGLMQFARSRRLIGPRVTPARRLTAGDMGGYGRQVRILAWVFGLALRVFGPNRYFALMRYLAHASSIRNQPPV